MKQILVNLKRFDIPRSLGGVNNLAPMSQWAATIIDSVRVPLSNQHEAEFLFFFPESHLLSAVAAAEGSRLAVGCQGVSRRDTIPGGPFGAFTTERTAHSMVSAGVTACLVGHSEERSALADVLTRFSRCAPDNPEVTNFIDEEVNARARAAQQAGLRIVLCIGEQAAQRDNWPSVLRDQLDRGLAGLSLDKVTLAYEPVWAIGPGKTPPDHAQISQVAALIKSAAPTVPLVYGGGLKQENAAMLASITDVDGGLIALTRFTGQIGFNPDEFLNITTRYLTG